MTRATRLLAILEANDMCCSLSTGEAGARVGEWHALAPSATLS